MFLKYLKRTELRYAYYEMLKLPIVMFKATSNADYQ
jgi:hypothetical protein